MRSMSRTWSACWSIRRGWPASSRTGGDVGLPPSPPAVPRLPFPAQGGMAAPVAVGCFPHPIRRAPTTEPFPLHASPAAPHHWGYWQDRVGDRHVPVSVGSFIGTSRPSPKPAALPTLCLAFMQGGWRPSSTPTRCRHSSWSWEPSCWR